MIHIPKVVQYDNDLFLHLFNHLLMASCNCIVNIYSSVDASIAKRIRY